MIQQWDAYLNDLAATGPVRQRLAAAVSVAVQFVEGEVVDIFLSESREDATGPWRKDKLWLITSTKRLLEFPLFLRGDGHTVMDCAVLREEDLYWTMRAKNFIDLDNITEDSELEFRFHLGGPLTGQMNASGVNCKYLYRIFKKYFSDRAN